MDFEKTANREREEIHKAIWNIADNLRGAVDGWDFKSYVIGTMFYRFLSEDFADYINQGEHEAGNPDFNYADLDDADVEEAREDMIRSKGYFLYPSELFCNVCKRAKDDENLNETMERIFRHIEESTKGHESEKAFAGLFKNFDVNSDKLGASVARRNERLRSLLFGIRDMNLGAASEHKVDAFGDTYEFLMSMYAANAGKSGGEFFTPQQTAMLCARLALYGKDTVRKVYDPTCGSGSLLLKAARVIGGNNILKGYYGQEINPTSYALCRINMILHGVGFEKFDIACEDTLRNPKHWDKGPFDAIVSNPPYSLPWVGSDKATLINDPRFAPAGVLAPKSKADFAFIMHCLSWLAGDGCAAIVCFPGIFYRGGAEQKIRQYLIDNNYIDALIQLSDKQFFGTGISVVILVLRKNKPDNSVLFIDASDEAVKVNNGKEMTDENIDRIMAWYAAREEVAHTVHKATHDEIAANNYNLSVSTYIEAEKKGDEVDIDELNARIATIVDKENRLRAEIDAIIKDLENFARLYPEGVENKTLEEIAHYANQRTDVSNVNERNYVGVENLLPDKKGKTIAESIPNSGTVIVFDRDDILIGNIRPYLRKIWFADCNGGTNGDVLVVQVNDINIVYPKYLFYALSAESFFFYDMQYSKGAKMPRGDKNAVMQYVIPVPPLPVQQAIVDILDRFDALCNDLTEGLPAEIAARRQQYEYYRNKLLSL